MTKQNTFWKTSAHGICAFVVITIITLLSQSASVSAATTCTPSSVSLFSRPGVTIEAGGSSVTTYQSPLWTTLPNAQWIWKSNTVTAPNSVETVTYVEQFAINGTTTSGSITAAADDYYKIFVNDTLIADENADIFFLSTKTFNIASALTTGTNTVKIEHTNAAYFFPGLGTSENNPAGMLYSIEASYTTCTTTPETPNNPSNGGGPVSTSGPVGGGSPATPVPTPVTPTPTPTENGTGGDADSSTTGSGSVLGASTSTTPKNTTTGTYRPTISVGTEVILDATTTATTTETATTTATSTPIVATKDFGLLKCILIAIIIALVIYIIGEFVNKDRSNIKRRIAYYAITTAIAALILMAASWTCPIIPLIILMAILIALVGFKIA